MGDERGKWKRRNRKAGTEQGQNLALKLNNNNINQKFKVGLDQLLAWTLPIIGNINARGIEKFAKFPITLAMYTFARNFQSINLQQL